MLQSNQKFSRILFFPTCRCNTLNQTMWPCRAACRRRTLHGILPSSDAGDHLPPPLTGCRVSGPGCDVSVSCSVQDRPSPAQASGGPDPELFIRAQTSWVWPLERRAAEYSQVSQCFIHRRHSLRNTFPLISALLYFTNMPIFTFSWQTLASIDDRSFSENSSSYWALLNKVNIQIRVSFGQIQIISQKMWV